MKLHSLTAVKADAETGVYIATVDITDAHGDRYDTEYVSRDGDIYGLAPAIRTAITQWIADGKPVDSYVEPGPVVPDRVTARQFKLQLLAAGLLNQVEGWIASQSQAVQIAYANSGTFVRDEPMMQSGFQALGFTSDQIDAFFTAASTL